MKLLSVPFVIATFLLVTCLFGPSDDWLRDQIVLLDSDTGSCTGVIIEAPSGKHFILSAGHCSHFSGKMPKAVTEDGKIIETIFVAEDDTSDLMLLKTKQFIGPGVTLASSIDVHETVKALTRGGAMPTYRTDGEALGLVHKMIPDHALQSNEDILSCMGSRKYGIDMYGFAPVCALSLNFLVSTARGTHGSSGGPLFNMKGQLVGIFSAFDENFSYYIRLEDIKRFLKGR